MSAGPDAGDPPPTPLDCAALDGPGRTVCEARPDGCAVVFTDRAGCAATCAAGGLRCVEARENLDDACAPDLARPALGCDVATGHGSDWCLCGPCPEGECSPPPPPVADCDRYPFSADALLAERVGFGARTTGGDPGNVYRVSTRDDGGPGSLRAALESDESLWIVFDVEGEFRFDFDSPVRIRSNKTVDGRGRDVRLVDGRFEIRDGADNIIFSDLEASFEDPQDNEGDLFSIRGRGGATPADYETRNLWFHHLDLHHAGDGLIDVRGGTEITISWTHVHDHTKVMLHTSDSESDPSPGMHITYHHNFFDTVTRRSPHFAYGKADFFNNYHYRWYEYGAASIDGAEFLSEANIYEAREGEFCLVPCPDPSPHGGGNDFFVSKIAVSHDWAQDQSHGNVKSVGDLLLQGARVETNEPGRVFDRATYYAADVDEATPALAARLRAETGPRRDFCR
jgi:pectate lyase